MSISSHPISIYALVDNRTTLPFYVGKAFDVGKRFNQHANLAIAGHPAAKYRMMREITEAGSRVSLVTLDKVSHSEWREREKIWITIFRSAGIQLLNSTSGGDGPDGKAAKKSNDLSAEVEKYRAKALELRNALEVERRKLKCWMRIAGKMDARNPGLWTAACEMFGEVEHYSYEAEEADLWEQKTK